MFGTTSREDLRAMIGDNPQTDLAAAVMFAALGAAAVWVAADYPVGTLRRLGPGALPLGLGVLLMLVGAGIAAQVVLRLLRSPAGRRPPMLAWPGWPARHVLRSTACVVGGLVLFALMIRPLGLFLATATLVFLSSRADSGTPLWGSAVLALAIPALSAAIFVWGIGLPIRVWP